MYICCAVSYVGTVDVLQGAVGLELWSMTDNIVFDNFIISDNFTVVEDFAAITWEMKNLQERAAESTGVSHRQAI